MTTRELRTRRRAEERRAAKLSRETDSAPPDEPGTPTQLGFVSQNTSPLAEIARTRRIQVNRQNAQASTGPRTPTGKLASSRNSLKHGLTTGELIVPGEDPADFDALLAALNNEYQPAAVTEELLVKQMAEGHWLAQRAVRLQNTCFHADGIDEKRLALFIRYQTTHQRAFHKALGTLIGIQKDRRKQRIGFVSQSGSVSKNDFVSQQASEVQHATGFVSQNTAQSAPDTTGKSAQAA